MAEDTGIWWHTDGEGRRIGWLWPEDLEAIMESYYGNGKKWVDSFAADFGYSRSAIDRWRSGRNPVPKSVAQIVNMLGTLQLRKLPLTPVKAEWLPEGVTGANARSR